ncbi:MAG: polymer-forming cytoskeletal protein [Xanthomonadales bacterium]|nr:polymer-forming cytoskeletal protein [Xanthomonadales bacterium]
MWKKDETPKQPPADFSSRDDDKPSTPKESKSGHSLIGKTLVVEGSIKGDQELLVEGRVKGDITLPQNTVTVGKDGKVEATIAAKVIIVEGSVEGDLKGGEQVEIRRSGNVLGNIIGPRVGLEDGAQFKGNIDMSPKGRAQSAPEPARPSTPEPSKPSGPTDQGSADQGKNEQAAGKTADPKLPG